MDRSMNPPHSVHSAQPPPLLPPLPSVPTDPPAGMTPASPTLAPSWSAEQPGHGAISLGPPLLLAAACATLVLLIASLLTIAILLSRLRRSERTIADLHLQLTSLAAAAVVSSTSSRLCSPPHHPHSLCDTQSVYLASSGRPYSMALADDEAIIHSARSSHILSAFPPPPGSALTDPGLDRCCSQCRSTLLGPGRWPPPTAVSAGVIGTPMSAAMTFRTLGRQSIASAAPSVCPPSQHGGRPTAHAVDWTSQVALPSTPTLLTQSLDKDVDEPSPTVSSGSDAEAPVPASTSPGSMRGTSLVQCQLTQSPSTSPTRIVTSRTEASRATAAAALAAPVAMQPAALHTPAPPAPPPATSAQALLDRHPSVHSDKQAPSFWFQLPPADSTTDLVPPDPVAGSLSATLHLDGPTGDHTLVTAVSGEAHTGSGGWAGDATSGFRPTTAQSTLPPSSERDAFLAHGGPADESTLIGLAGLGDSAGGAESMVAGGCCAG